jgi:C-terminal novel E3 ligase, LRR-interacting
VAQLRAEPTLARQLSQVELPGSPLQAMNAQSLSTEEKSALESALESRMAATDVQLRASATRLWLSVQTARQHGISDTEHEQHQTFSNFMRVIGAESLPLDVRLAAAKSLNRYLDADALAQEDSDRLRSSLQGVSMLDEIRANIRRNERHLLIPLGKAFLLAEELQYHQEGALLSRGDDSALQEQPLGPLVNHWLRSAGMPELNQEFPAAPSLPSGADQPTGEWWHDVGAEEFEQAFPQAERVRNGDRDDISSVGDSDDISSIGDEDINDLEDDLDSQTKPIGLQVNEWLRAAGAPNLAAADSFEAETNANAFARLLARRQPTSRDAVADEVLQDGVNIVIAIANDAELRALVFAMSETALGSCHDNVVEGFSNIVNEVRNHQMVAKIRNGEISEDELKQWGVGQFRLDELRSHVHRFISEAIAKTEAALTENAKIFEPVLASLNTHPVMHGVSTEAALEYPFGLMRDLDHAIGESALLDPRWGTMLRACHLAAERIQLLTARDSLVNESVETMLHAKVALREALGLPKGTPTEMAFERISSLTSHDIKAIEKAVRQQEADETSVIGFLLNNPTWRAALKEFRREEFDKIEDEFSNDPFYGLDFPPDGDEHVAAQMAYNEVAKDLERRRAQADADLLLQETHRLLTLQTGT